MSVSRGDVVMRRFPHAGGTRGKKRPVLVVQSDVYNAKVRHAMVAEITTNLAAASDPACLLIDVSTPEGKASGLTQNSVVGRLFLATVAETRISAPIGKRLVRLEEELQPDRVNAGQLHPLLSFLRSRFFRPTASVQGA